MITIPVTYNSIPLLTSTDCLAKNGEQGIHQICLYHKIFSFTLLEISCSITIANKNFEIKLKKKLKHKFQGYFRIKVYELE